MPRVEEFINNGLVTSRDPALLSPGELVQAKNGVYLPNSDTLQRFLGRSAWATVSAGEDISGITDAKFRDGTHYVIAQAADRYWIMDAESDSPLPLPLSSTNGDEVGAYFVAYSDSRASDKQVYVQKFGADGVAQWTANGVVVSTSTGTGFRTVKALSAGDGGCFIAYTDNRSGSREDLYIQRLSSTGSVAWTAGGVLLANAAISSFRVVEGIVEDGTGGAIVLWRDDRSGLGIFVQRVDAAGAAQWTSGGVRLGTSSQKPSIISDAGTGAYVAWYEGGTMDACHVDSTGAAATGWSLGGTALHSSGTGANYRPALTVASTGVIVVFLLTTGAAQVQLMTAGVKQWGATGINLNPSSGTAAGNPAAISDGSDGIICVWQRSGTGSDTISASRVDSTSAKQWGADGVVVRASSATAPANLRATTDGANGVLVVWDQSPLPPASSDYGVAAMRVDSTGTLAWTSPYTIIADTTNAQEFPAVCTDGDGGLYATWYDARGASALYIQQIGHAGTAQYTANGLAVASTTHAGASETYFAIAFSGASAPTVTEGGQLVNFQSQNKYYLLNGASLNRVLLPNGTTRQHGMNPVITSPRLVTAAGTWTASATGLFEYWVTEVYKTTASADGGTATAPFEMESTFTADPTTVNVTATNQAVRVYLPAAQNLDLPAGALFYRVYRTAGPKATAAERVFPTGIRVSNDIAVGATDYFEDGTGAVTSFTLPATVSSSNGWTSTSNILLDDTNLAQITGVTFGEDHYGRLVVRDFGLTSVADPIMGVEIQIKGYHTGNTPILFVDFSLDGGTTWSKPSNVTPESTSSGAQSTVTGGNSTNTWGLFPTSTGFSDANFRVRLTASCNNPFSSCSFFIDYIKVKVYYNGTATSTSEAFNTVVLQIEGQTASIGADGLPPIASTGCMFDGSALTDDINNPGVLCYSKAGDPEAFPSLYRLRAPGGDNAAFTGIIACNNRAIAGTSEKLYRINYLPTQDDDIFNGGRAIDEISSTHGVTRPTCITLFTSLEGRQEAAFVSANGVFATDGASIRDLSMDIAWSDLFPLADSDSVFTNVLALKNDPDLKCLLLVTTSGTYPISYAPRHQKPGTGVKWTGPVITNNSISGSAGTLKSAHIIRRATGFWRQLWGYGGTVAGGAGQIWIGDFYTYEKGYTIPHTTANDRLIFRTRDLYLAGRGGQFPVGDIMIYGNQGTYGTVPNGTLSIISLYTNVGSASASGTIDGTGTSLLQTPFGSINADAINITYTASGNGRYGVISAILNPGEPADTALRA